MKGRVVKTVLLVLGSIVALLILGVTHSVRSLNREIEKWNWDSDPPRPK